MPQDLFDIALPKWPQMIVRGNWVTPEQASEIIRRTDIFFSWPTSAGNNEEWRDKVIKLIQYPTLEMFSDNETDSQYNQYYFACDKWRRDWGYIETNYVHNDWIASSFVYGPNGWCSPNGDIFYNYNVGKWPSVQDIFDDWCKISKEFPFLTCGIALMNGEHSEIDTKALVCMRVENGTVTLYSVEEKDIAFTGCPTYDNVILSENELNKLMCSRIIYGNNREQGIPLKTIKSWATKLIIG